MKALFKSKEFIPGDIVFKKREAKAANSGRAHISAESSSEHCLEKVGDYLIEDFMMICPDFQELRKLREGRKEAREFSLAEYYFFNFNQSYKSRKPEYLKEIARRAFPLGAQARRRTIDNYEQFKRDMEF